MEAVIIEKEAFQLPDRERAVLACHLLDIISQKPVGLDDAWHREADARMKAFHEGHIVAVAGQKT